MFSSLFAVSHQILGKLIQKRGIKRMIYQEAVVMRVADDDLSAGQDKAARLVRRCTPNEDERNAPAVIGIIAPG